MSNTMLAYLAGFIDGEGSISIVRKANGHNLVLSVSQLNPEPLFLLQQAFGGSLHRAPDRRGNRSMVVWTTAARRALAAIEQIRPHLTVKADEADLAIEFQSKKDLWDDKEIELTRRETIRLEIKACKYRTYDHIDLPPTIKVPRMSSPRRLQQKERPPAKPKRPVLHKTKLEKSHSTQGRSGRPAKGQSKMPDAATLERDYLELGQAGAAAKYGTSRTTIYNWLDKYGIERTGLTDEVRARMSEGLRRSWHAGYSVKKTIDERPIED